MGSRVLRTQRTPGKRSDASNGAGPAVYLPVIDGWPTSMLPEILSAVDALDVKVAIALKQILTSRSARVVLRGLRSAVRLDSLNVHTITRSAGIAIVPMLPTA